jgi:putative ABC transport system permease protein
VIAFLCSLLAAVTTLWLASRRMFRASAKDLLVGEAWSAAVAPKKTGRFRSKWRVVAPWLPLICLVLAIALSFAGSKAKSPEQIAGMFFGAGFLLLIAGLLVARRWLRSQEHPASGIQRPASGVASIGLRNVTRRPGRSLAVIGMMAGGIFLVIAVNAFRLSADTDPLDRHSGTGGFALIGESTLPVYEDLNSSAGWDAFGLDEKLMQQTKVVPFRMREGDDASCLNLNRAQNPAVSAVNPKLLAERDAFSFVEGSWSDLKNATTELPAVADQATALWGLGKGVGDTLTYTGADGKPFTVKFVGLLAGSVLQGKVIISEEAFLAKFPDAAGYKYFLMDVPQTSVPEVSAHLTKQIQSRGLALEPAQSRLAAFMAVQNTYIGIFTVLGGLGVLLGTAGLGVLAARNILERKGEFGLMQALGFLPGALRRMVLSEHAALLAAGLVLGLLSAAVAVWPNVRQSGGALPVGFLVWLNVGIFAFGVAVCWLAARFALSGKLLEAVRRE